MQHIKEIDGLRGLAVLSVVFYHADFRWLPGGYLGVDIFFVISGFLITKLILEQIKSDSFSVVEFYVRRVVRLIPALFLVIVSSLLLSSLLVPSQYLGPLADSSRYAAFFLSNLYFLFFVDYFSPSADFSILGHTWSLAVEEQFYLVYPWLILLLLRVTKKTVWITLFSLTLLSFALQLFLIHFQTSVTLKNSAFYLLPARAWEILCGAMLALSINQKSRQSYYQSNNLVHKICREAVPIIGLFCVLLPLLVAKQSNIFYQVITVSGCLLLISFSNYRCFVGRLLGFSLLGFFGLISYCLYLWHQPIFAIYRFVYLDDSPDSGIALLLIALSIALSIFTFRLIEIPMRKRYRDNKRGGFVLLFVFLASVWGITGFVKQETIGHEHVLAAELTKSEAVYFDHVDDRTFMVSWLNQIDLSVESVVMGSSRIMNLDTNPITGEMINNSVKGASVEDLIAISPLAVLQTDARQVFLGIDPWLMNNNARQNRWESIVDQFNLSLAAIANESELDVSSKNEHLDHDIHYFCMVNASTDSLEIEARNKLSKNGRLIVSGGSQQPRNRFTNHQAKGAYEYAFRDFEWSSSNFARLLLLSRYFLTNGVDVAWILTPYHPVVAGYSKSVGGDLLGMVERRITAEANSHGISVLGSYSNKRVGCAETEFYDVAHPHSDCIKKALSTRLSDKTLTDH